MDFSLFDVIVNRYRQNVLDRERPTKPEGPLIAANSNKSVENILPCPPATMGIPEGLLATQPKEVINTTTSVPQLYPSASLYPSAAMPSSSASTFSQEDCVEMLSTPDNDPEEQDDDPEEKDISSYLRLITSSNVAHISTSGGASTTENIRNAPLFSGRVKKVLESGELAANDDEAANSLTQYGLLGLRRKSDYNNHDKENDLVFANMNAPWSTFICGVQGSGKSHTLSVLLENALLTNSPAGVLPHPLAAIVFHYDKFSSYVSTQLCETAYLCSAGIPVRVLVSPSNMWTMHELYSRLPGLPAGSPRPKVLPLYFSERQLSISTMMTLMAVSENNRPPLYLEVLYRVLRDMAAENKGKRGLNYLDFRARMAAQGFSREQDQFLSIRLQLLESFLDSESFTSTAQPEDAVDIWEFEPGTLTIVDLSCPFVNENDACSLFSICLSLFMENRSRGGMIVALDEAHKVCMNVAAKKDLC